MSDADIRRLVREVRRTGVGNAPGDILRAIVAELEPAGVWTREVWRGLAQASVDGFLALEPKCACGHPVAAHGNGPVGWRCGGGPASLVEATRKGGLTLRRAQADRTCPCEREIVSLPAGGVWTGPAAGPS